MATKAIGTTTRKTTSSYDS